MPLLQVHTNDDSIKGNLLLVDLKRYAKWEQLRLPDEASNEVGDLYLQVIDLNSDEEARQKILDANPDWLSEYPDKVAYLRERVVVKASERFQILINAPDAATRLILLSVEDDD